MPRTTKPLTDSQYKLLEWINNNTVNYGCYASLRDMLRGMYPDVNRKMHNQDPEYRAVYADLNVLKGRKLVGYRNQQEGINFEYCINETGKAVVEREKPLKEELEKPRATGESPEIPAIDSDVLNPKPLIVTTAGIQVGTGDTPARGTGRDRR